MVALPHTSAARRTTYFEFWDPEQGASCWHGNGHKFLVPRNSTIVFAIRGTNSMLDVLVGTHNKTHLCRKRGCLCAQDDLNIWGPAAIMQAFSLAGRSLGSLGSLGPLLAMQPFARATKIMSRILSRTRARGVEHF